MTSVLHVLTRTNVGGPSVILSCLLDESSNTSTAISVARGSTSPDEGDYFAGDDRALHFHEIPGLGRRLRPFDDFVALFHLVRLMRRLRPDVVHTHMAKAGALGRLAAILAGVPVRVHTFHGHLLTGYFPPLVTRLVVLIERLLGLVTTHSIVVGSAVRDDLVAARMVRAHRSSVIPPCVAPATVVDRTVARQRLGLPVSGPVVGLIGRLTGIKRPDRFVEVARRAASTIPDALFVLVGDGPLAPSLERSTADLANVRLLGWQRDVTVALCACDVVVLCSDNEGMPVALIEAAQLRVPVVAARVGSVAEVVDDGVGGFLVPHDDIEAYIEAIGRVVGGEHGLDLDAAATRAIERFGAPTIAGIHSDLYERLLYKRS